MSISVDPKDPDEVLDYTVDWTARLLTDTITASDFAPADESGEITIDSMTIVSGNQKTTVWLSGGVEGETVLVTNHITTAGGREMDQTIKLKIRSK